MINPCLIGCTSTLAKLRREIDGGGGDPGGGSHPTVTLPFALGGSTDNFPEYAILSGTWGEGTIPANVVYRFTNNVYQEGPGDIGPGYSSYSGYNNNSTFWPYYGYAWYWFDAFSYNWLSTDYGLSIELLNGIDGTLGFRIYGYDEYSGQSINITFTPTSP